MPSEGLGDESSRQNVKALRPEEAWHIFKNLTIADVAGVGEISSGQEK